MNTYEVRVDVFSGFRRIENVQAEKYTVYEWGILEFSAGTDVVATFASGKWVYVKKV